eukprot:6270457-Prymnesium_polylepis.1
MPYIYITVRTRHTKHGRNKGASNIWHVHKSAPRSLAAAPRRRPPNANQHHPHAIPPLAMHRNTARPALSSLVALPPQTQTQPQPQAPLSTATQSAR